MADPVAIPLLPDLPPAPNRRQSRTEYPITADTWAAAIGPWSVQMNVIIGQINLLLPEISSVSANAAKAQAAAKAAQDAQAATEAAAGNPIRLGLLQAIALCF